jgi:protein-disulfide isomerase
MKQLTQGRNGVILGVGLAAIAAAVALILVSVLGSSSGTGSTSATVQVTGAAETNRLLQGIPQHGNVLGSPKAPVTMVEFADLQCPFCATYAVDALPTVVRDYVRPGKVKLVFNGMTFIGHDSKTVLRTAYAASLQGKLWNVVDLLYKNQGAENSGWVSDPLLRAVGDAVPGLDTQKMLAAATSTEVDQALAAGDEQAQQASVSQTPTFFAGRTGTTLHLLRISSLDPAPFRAALDPLLK